MLRHSLAGKRSRALFRRAVRIIPGGVNSPVRAFKAVGGEPLFIARGRGARIRDADGRWYVDFMGSWGPLVLGHACPAVVRAAAEAARRGSSFGAPTAGEVELARRVVELVPGIEMARLVSSGTEAAMSALRLARAFTKRDLVLKFEGCYHGHVDSLLVSAGSGATTLGVPDSPGVPTSFARTTLLAPYNDLSLVRRIFRRRGRQIAAVIVEPVAGNMGVVPPKPGFLEGLRRTTRAHGALLIFDEVITGFRLAPGGAQELFGVVPDLTLLGKILGGGFPLGAYGGRREIMERVAPSGPVYQAGTLSGNPVAVAAGLAALREVARPGFHKRLDEKGRFLAEALREAARRAGAAACVNQIGSMLTVFFTAGPVTDYANALRSDRSRFAAFFRGMLARGFYLPPAQFESWFVSAAHEFRHLERAAAAAEEAMRCPVSFPARLRRNRKRNGT